MLRGSSLVAFTLFAGALSGCSNCGGTHPSAQSDAGATAGWLPDEPSVDSPFEGVIEAEILTQEGASSYDDRISYKFTVRGRSVRWDLPNQPDGIERQYRVYRASEHRFLSVNPERKQIIASSEELPGDSGAPHVQMTLVDAHGGFVGIPCERWRIVDTTHRYETCLAKGFVPFPFQQMPEPISRVIPFNGELVARGYFPLLVTVLPLDAPSNTTVGSERFQVAKVIREAVSADTFRVPAYPVVNERPPAMTRILR